MINQSSKDINLHPKLPKSKYEYFLNNKNYFEKFSRLKDL